MKNDMWFAGFVDGEGCFLAQRLTHGGLAPRFSVGLRADDLPVLEKIQASFGGRLQHRNHPSSPNQNPAVVLRICAKDEMRDLVAYFDRFPLRSKKLRDYVVWRAMVMIYCEGGYRADGLEELTQELVKGRVYS